MSKQIRQMFSAAFFILLLTACATQAQKQAQNLVNQVNYAKTEAEKCISQVQKKDVYTRVDQFLILSPNDPHAIEKMTIDRFATEGEKNDLLQLHSLLFVCRKEYLENLTKAHPDFAAVVANALAQSDENIVHIMKNEMTLGRANEEKNKILSAAQNKWNSVAANITQQLNSAHLSELQNRQRAAAAMQQWSYQQQLLNSLNRPVIHAPVTTNCHQFGNTINCQSY